MVEKRRYRRLEIVPVCGGWIVMAGCQQIVYMDTEEGRNKMKADFEAYLLDPAGVEAKMMSSNIGLDGMAYPVAPAGLTQPDRCLRPESPHVPHPGRTGEELYARQEAAEQILTERGRR